MLGLGLLGGSISASANDTDHALDTAPDGLDASQDTMQIFRKGNSTALLTTKQNGKFRDIARLTDENNCDSKYEVGTYFSKDKTFNYKINQNIGMWVYTGNHGKSDNSGDGMAFVLQNDDRGDYAVGGDSGQTLGVYGKDTWDHGNNNKVSESAIQNSWALEFDTHTNNDAETGDGFDRIKSNNDIRYNQHVAATYPGDGGDGVTYTNQNYGLFDWFHYHTINHQGALSNGNDGWLASGKWHHVSLKWDASAKTMTYTIDDKANPNGDSTVNPKSETVKVDTNKFKANDGLVHWGFTAANGGNTQTNMVVMENQPAKEQSNSDVTVSSSLSNSDGSAIDNGSTLNFTKLGETKKNYNYKTNLSLNNDVAVKGAAVKLNNTPADNMKYKSGVITASDGNEYKLGDDQIAALNAGEALNLATIPNLTKKGDNLSLNLVVNFSNGSIDTPAKVDFKSVPQLTTTDKDNNLKVTGGEGIANTLNFEF